MRIHQYFSPTCYVLTQPDINQYLLHPSKSSVLLSLILRSRYYSQVSRSQILIAGLFMAEIHQSVMVVCHSLSMFIRGHYITNPNNALQWRNP